MTIDLDARIPNNVDLASDSKLRRALESWQEQELGSDGRAELAAVMAKLLPEGRATRRAHLEAACTRVRRLQLAREESARAAGEGARVEVGSEPSEAAEDAPQVSGFRTTFDIPGARPPFDSEPSDAEVVFSPLPPATSELSVPIAVGETLHSAHEFRRYVDERACGVVQIDPVTNGGISASLRALEMANAAGLDASSHYCDELAAHLLCVSTRSVYLEKHAFALDPYLHTPQQVKNGRVRPTEAPGTGMRFDERALARFAG